MERVEKLLADGEYYRLLKRLERLEEDRIYCHHGVEHLLAVARIAYLHSLEEQLGLEKEDIYMAALLHDLGRVDEYENGIPHDKAGEKRAGYFLEKTGYPLRKRALIAEAVRGHREKSEEGARQKEGLKEILARADKESRNCGFCDAYDECKWSPEEKQRKLKL